MKQETLTASIFHRYVFEVFFYSLSLLLCFFFLLLVAPEISKHPKNTRVVEGQAVVFRCLVQGNPKPSVRWTKNEELNLAANPRLRSTLINDTHTLIIVDVHPTDAGQYRCLANNSVGQTTSSAATLAVEEYCKCLTQFTNPTKNHVDGFSTFLTSNFWLTRSGF